MNTEKELNLNEMETISGGNEATDNMLRQGGKGAAYGAAVGAAAGSCFPIVGTVGGALVGTAVGFFSGAVAGLFEKL